MPDHTLKLQKRSILSRLLYTCEIETFCAGGPGGQHQNKTESAVRLRHLPSGIIVVCRDERSQHCNKMRALAILEERLRKRAERQKPRIKTRVSEGQKVRRRDEKALRGKRKRLRRKPEIEIENR
jgi:protein subunit release factor A